jgi:hypothetical protein
MEQFFTDETEGFAEPDEGAIILTSNKAFSERGDIFAGDAVMASAALDRLLHRCTVINIRGESNRLKEKRRAAKSAFALTDRPAECVLFFDLACHIQT